METDTERRPSWRDTHAQREGSAVRLEAAADQGTAGAVRSCKGQGRILPCRLQRKHGPAGKLNLKLQASTSRRE